MNIFWLDTSVDLNLYYNVHINIIRRLFQFSGIIIKQIMRNNHIMSCFHLTKHQQISCSVSLNLTWEMWERERPLVVAMRGVAPTLLRTILCMLLAVFGSTGTLTHSHLFQAVKQKFSKNSKFSITTHTLFNLHVTLKNLKWNIKLDGPQKII